MKWLTFAIVLSISFKYILGTCPNSKFTEYNGMCYNIAVGTPNYSQAQATCAATTPVGNVVKVASQEEQNFLNGIYPASTYWLGLTKVGSAWQWYDGTALSYASWASGQPSGTGTCATANNPTLGLWSAVDCSIAAQAAVCELASTGTTTTTGAATTATGAAATTTTAGGAGTTAAPTGTCPSSSFIQWTIWCYIGSTGASTYDTATQTCSSQTPPAMVVTVMSQEEQNFLNAQYPSGAYWLGLTKVDGLWKWADGAIFVYSNWASGQPSGTGTCVQANNPSLGLWSAVDCSSTNTAQTVCKERSSTSTTTTSVGTDTAGTTTTTAGGITTTTAGGTTTTAATGTSCTTKADCLYTQLCSSGVCVETSSLTPCVSGTCTVGVCDSGYCVIIGSTVPAETTTPAAPACTESNDCNWTDQCVNGVCVDSETLPSCKTSADCSSGQICEYGRCVSGPPTTPPPVACTEKGDCLWTQLCSNGYCTDVDDLTPCPSGTCTAGVCVDGYCVDDEVATTTGTTGTGATTGTGTTGTDTGTTGTGTTGTDTGTTGTETTETDTGTTGTGTTGTDTTSTGTTGSTDTTSTGTTGSTDTTSTGTTETTSTASTESTETTSTASTESTETATTTTTVYP